MSDHAQATHAEVHVIIDHKNRVSPNPTTGAALYLLGQVPAGYDLFREKHGHEDDEFIPNNATPLALHEGDQFFTVQSSLNPGAIRG